MMLLISGTPAALVIEDENKMPKIWQTADAGSGE
jgi:hypothetical protein